MKIDPERLESAKNVHVGDRLFFDVSFSDATQKKMYARIDQTIVTVSEIECNEWGDGIRIEELKTEFAFRVKCFHKIISEEEEYSDVDFAAVFA